MLPLAAVEAVAPAGFELELVLSLIGPQIEAPLQTSGALPLYKISQTV